MPIKTMTTRTICNPNDFVDNCSSIEELQKLISKCQNKIMAIKNNKLVKCAEQIIDITKEIAEFYPYEESPFYDEDGEAFLWKEMQEPLEDYIDKKIILTK